MGVEVKSWRIIDSIVEGDDAVLRAIVPELFTRQDQDDGDKLTRKWTFLGRRPRASPDLHIFPSRSFIGH